MNFVKTLTNKRHTTKSYSCYVDFTTFENYVKNQKVTGTIMKVLINTIEYQNDYPHISVQRIYAIFINY